MQLCRIQLLCRSRHAWQIKWYLWEKKFYAFNTIRYLSQSLSNYRSCLLVIRSPRCWSGESTVWFHCFIVDEGSLVAVVEIKVSPCLWRDIPETFRAKGRPAGGGGLRVAPRRRRSWPVTRSRVPSGQGPETRSLHSALQGYVICPLL